METKEVLPNGAKETRCMMKSPRMRSRDFGRLNRKYVWETAKRVCDFINTHEDLITITTFSENRVVMKKGMRVVKEVNNTERKRRQTSRKERGEALMSMTQRAKGPIAHIKRGGMRKEEIERRIECIFGRGIRHEIETATTKDHRKN